MEVTAEVESWGELRKVPLATGRDFAGPILRDAECAGSGSEAYVASEVEEVSAEDFVLLASHVAGSFFLLIEVYARLLENAKRTCRRQSEEIRLHQSSERVGTAVPCRPHLRRGSLFTMTLAT